MLNAALQRALGEDAVTLVQKACRTWFEQLSNDDAVIREQVDRSLMFINETRRSLDGRYPTLRKACPDWSGIATAFEEATVYGETERRLRRHLAASTVPGDDVRRNIDGILTALVQNYETEEAQLRRQIATMNAIIDHLGDVAAAKAAQQSTRTWPRVASNR